MGQEDPEGCGSLKRPTQAQAPLLTPASPPLACSPESLRSRNDVFYLQPERSCIAESPLWYSVIPMDKSMLESMLNRILAVREIYEEPSRGAGGLDDDMD